MITLVEQLLALIILLLISPIFLIISFLIKITSKGSVFFTQKRVGKDLKIFQIYKFRTMVEDADRLKKNLLDKNEADGPVFKIKNDPRYTKFGRWLAKRGIDEIPQLINILKGEMSFVGPRPLPVDEARRIPKKYWERFMVKPGIISTWAINGAFHNNFNLWMKMDVNDAKRKSFFHDFLILIKGIKLFFIFLFNGKNGEK
ncbi:MAG: sugar transferase [Microgenomates group bacterium]